MAENKYESIENKLDILINLTAKQIVKDMSNSQAAPYLRGLGFEPKQIAIILGSTPGAIRTYVSAAKKESEKNNV